MTPYFHRSLGLWRLQSALWGRVVIKKSRARERATDGSLVSKTCCFAVCVGGRPKRAAFFAVLGSPCTAAGLASLLAKGPRPRHWRLTDTTQTFSNNESAIFFLKEGFYNRVKLKCTFVSTGVQFTITRPSSDGIGSGSGRVGPAPGAAGQQPVCRLRRTQPGVGQRQVCFLLRGVCAE